MRGSRAGALLSGWAVAAAICAGVPGVASAAPHSPAVAAPAVAGPAAFDQQMIVLINQARVANGRSPLQEAVGLDAAAAYWSGRLDAGATSYQLAHNPNAWNLVAADGAANRLAWGENVAWSSSTGSTAADIFTAYMHSPGHRANILSANYHFIGMGTAFGAHGLWTTTEFTDAVQPGQVVVPVRATVPQPAPRPVGPVFTDGSILRDSGSGVIYQVVGGAPLPITSWAPFGGARPARPASLAQLKAMPRYPRDNTFILSGTEVYVIAGGAPLYVSSWAPYGRSYPWVRVDPATVASAGGAGPFAHLRKVPADGTFLRDLGSGAIYRIAGGAPIYVSNWAAVGGPQPFVSVDPSVLARAGGPGRDSHLTAVPAEGTLVRSGATARTYLVNAGVASYIASWAQVGGPQPFTVVDQWALAHAGQAGFGDHLRASVG